MKVSETLETINKAYPPVCKTSFQVGFSYLSDLNFKLMAKAKKDKKKTDKEKQQEAQLKAAKHGGFESLEHFNTAIGKKTPKKEK